MSTRRAAACAVAFVTASTGLYATSSSATARAAVEPTVFSAYTACAREHFALVETRGLRWYELDWSQRGFCADCGASVLWQREGRPTISIRQGPSTHRRACAPAATFFTEDAGDYYESP